MVMEPLAVLELMKTVKQSQMNLRRFLVCIVQGTDACNIYDDSYMFLLPGNSMGFAVNTGRIAGMSAAEYVEE